MNEIVNEGWARRIIAGQANERDSRRQRETKSVLPSCLNPRCEDRKRQDLMSSEQRAEGRDRTESTDRIDECRKTGPSPTWEIKATAIVETLE